MQFPSGHKLKNQLFSPYIWCFRCPEMTALVPNQGFGASKSIPGV